MATDAEMISGVTVRLVVDGEECAQWNALMEQWHYLTSSRMVGEQLRYVAEVNGYWVALLGWSAATLKSAPRRSWLGWNVVSERQRLHVIAQNARFLMLPGMRVPSLASGILSLNTARLSSDWEESYGHPVFLAETFVDVARFKGTCYRAAGWTEIGVTAGFARRAGDWSRHGVTKRLLVKPLHRWALAKLRCESMEEDRLSRVTPQEIRLSGADGLLETLGREVPDPRRRKGRRYPLVGMLGLLVAGMLAGKTNVEHIAAWGRGLPEHIRRRFGCPSDGAGQVRAPCANAYRYLIQEIDPAALDRAVRSWLRSSGIATQGMVIAIDGKTQRGSAHLDRAARSAVSLFLHEHGITVAQREIPAGTGEIPVARELIADPDLDLTGAIITADAAHTCAESAETVLKKKRTTSSSSRTINPTWRLRWPNVSKPTRAPRTPPATMATVMLAMSTAP